MGWKLAKAAHDAGLAGLVSERARMALDYMCWHTRDTDSQDEPAGLYWGGHLPIAGFILGDRAGTPGGIKAVQRAIRELVDAGLVEQTHPALRNKAAIYQIRIAHGWHTPVDNSPRKGSGNAH